MVEADVEASEIKVYGSVTGNLVGIGELRDPLRRDEARELDALQARGGERVREAELVAQEHGGALVLEAVAERDLVEGNLGRERVEEAHAHSAVLIEYELRSARFMPSKAIGYSPLKHAWQKPFASPFSPATEVSMPSSER